VPEAERLQIEPLGAGFWRVRLHFGFMDLPDVPRALALAAASGLALDPMATSYFLSHETVVPPPPRNPWAWRGRLFAGLSRGAGSATQFFGLPDNAVVELGARVRI
jgi:KUP system potassium uptake protein